LVVLVAAAAAGTARAARPVRAPYTDAEVSRAFAKAGIPLVGGKPYQVPAVLGKHPSPFDSFSGGIPSASGDPPYKYGVMVFVTSSPAIAKRLAATPLPSALQRALGNVFVAVNEFGSTVTPKRLPPQVVAAFHYLARGH
jgi:hypothetical protein